MKPIYSFIAIFFLLTGLSADVIFLKNGGRLEGIVKDEGDKVHITLPYGTMVIPKTQIQEIVMSITALDQYRQKMALIDPKDPESIYRLAIWCKENRLSNQYRKALEQVLHLNPNHEEARKELGYERHEGRWITHDEAMAIKGYIKYKGEWITQGQYQINLVEELKKAFQEERALRQEMESRLKIMEHQIASLERELEKAAQKLEEVAREASKPRYIIYRKYYPPWDSND